MAKPKKVDLAKEAAKANDGAEVEAQITDTLLAELAPESIRKLLKIKALPKKRKDDDQEYVIELTPAARADLLFTLTATEWKELKKAFDAMDTFLGKLEAWFVQEFRDSQTGVTGKVGRVEVKSKEIASVEDWEKFYANIKKKGEFDLLNKAVNQKAVKERWEQGKEVPGVGKFVKKVISLTAVKGK